MPFDENDDLLTGLESPPKRRRSNPLSKVLDIARSDNIPEDIANDFTRLIRFESGASHYDRRGKVKLSPPDPRTGERAVGAVQIKPSTAREVGINNPFDEDENIRAGLRYFAAGGADPVARRIRYFGGPGAQQRYQRTGRIPKGGDVLGTSFQDYVRNTSGGRPQRPVAPDDLVTGLATPEVDDDLLTGLQGQTLPRQINRDSEAALQPASTLQQSVPVSTGRFGAPQSRKFSRPLRPPRPKHRLADIATGGVGVVAPPGVGELRRLDDPATQQITRIQRQVTAEQTPSEREMRRAPGTQNARLLEEKLTENEEVIRRLEQEQDTAKREAAAAAEAKRLMAQFTRQDKAEIADFVNHLKGKGSTYTGIRTGARAVGASGLYKLAGLTDIANAVQKPLTGQDSWIPDFLKRKALAGELSIEEIPVEQRGQVAEFLTQLGLGLAEIAVAPGGPVGKFAGLAGTESIGRGQSLKEIAKETAKGATVGAVFKAAPMLNKPAQTVRGRAANLAREGAGIGAGTYAVERGFGTPVDEAALSAATNVALHGVLGARRLRGRKTDAGQAEAQRQGEPEKLPVEAVEGQPVVSAVEAPQRLPREAAQREAEVVPERIEDANVSNVQAQNRQTSAAREVASTEVPSLVRERPDNLPVQSERDIGSVSGESAPPLAKFAHKDFGQVTEAENQSGVARGSVRVVDQSGAEHTIQRPNGRGEGNVRAIPIKEPAPEVPPAVEQAERRSIQREFDKIKESAAEKPIWEMTRPELEAARGREQNAERDMLAQFLGKEDAERLVKLNRDYLNDKPVSAERDRLWAKLTPEQSKQVDEWYRASERRPSADDYRDYQRNLEEIAGSSDSEQTMANMLARIIPQLGRESDPSRMDDRGRRAYSQLQYAAEVSREAGLDPQRLEQLTKRAAGGLYGENARFMLDALFKANPAEPKAPIREEVIQPSTKTPIKEVINETTAPVKAAEPTIKSFDVERLGAGAQGTPEREVAPAPVISRPARPKTSVKRSVAAKARGEKPDIRTGLTPSQSKYVAAELEANVGRLINNRGEGEIKIKVPADGEFTVTSPEQASRLHQRVSGQPLEGFEKHKLPSVQGGTKRRMGAMPELSGQERFDRIVERFGSEEKALAATKKTLEQHKQEFPEDTKGQYEQEGIIAGLESRISERVRKAAEAKRLDRVEQEYINTPRVVKSARTRKSKREADKAKGIEYRRAGADPYELIDNITIKGWDLYSQKVKPTFEEWSRKLREEFGPESESHLRKVWVQLGGTEPSSTAAKREKVTADRAARGEEPILRPERKSDEQLFADAKAANAKDPTEPARLIDQVLNSGKSLNDTEVIQVDLHRQELKNKYDTVNKELDAATSQDKVLELSSKAESIEREMRASEEAHATSNTAVARALRATQVATDQDFRLLTMVSRAITARKRPLTRDERVEIKQQHDKIAELETKLTEANERIAKAEAERAVGRIKSDVAKENRRAGRRVKRESLDQEAAELRSLIAQAWKRQSASTSEIQPLMGLAKLDPEGEVTKLVVQLAKNRIQAKVGLKAEALVDEVHGLLKDVVDLNRREVAEMISGYGKTYELSKDAVDVRLRELKSIIAANLGKADIIEKGIRPLRRGLQRDKPTQEVRAAMRDLRDTLREHGMRVERSKGSAEEQQQSALDAAKTRTKNRIEDLSKWIKDGKRTVANKTEIIPDPELKTLQAERDRLQKVFEAIVDPAADLKKIENSLRSVNKSIVDLEAKIRAGNIAAKPREKGLTSPELEAARAEQKALRGIITDLRKAAKPQPTTPEIEAKRLLSANKALNTRMEKQIADLERRMAQGDFSKPQKREPVPFSRENLALQKQLEQVKQAYARANYKATRSRFGQITDELAKAANVPKTLKSMGDISAMFRQGGFYSITHPVEGFAKPTVSMLRSFTETGFRNVEQAIKNHPKFEQARRDGVEFTGVEKNDPNLSKMEESFFGSETVDVLATGKYNPLRAVKGAKDFSQRTFVSFLDAQRMNMYDVMAEGLKAQGINPRSDPASYKGIARLINIGTGRGNLGKTGNQAAPLLNIAMFSPRLVASRVQLLGNMFRPLAPGLPKGVRAQMVKDNVKFLAATAAFMGLATALGGTVNRDPDDADFLKIRFGRTTYDTLTGLQQPLRYIINMGRAALGGETYPGQDKAEMTKRFARSKASPSISPIINWVSGEDFMGRKFSPKREASEIVLPLPAKDFWEAMEKEGLIKGFLKATPALTGIGVQTYEQPPEKPKTAAEKLARKFVRDRIPDVARDEEEIERSEKKALLRSRARKGEDVKAEVEALGIPERQQKAILDAKGVTRLQEDFKRLGLKEALTVYSVMTRGEQQQVKDILATKAMNVDKLSEDEQTAMNKKLAAIGLTPPAERKRPERPKRPSRSSRRQQGYQWTNP